MLSLSKVASFSAANIQPGEHIVPGNSPAPITKPMNAHRKPIIILLFLVGLAINLLTIFSWDFSLISNDGIQYVSTASNWLEGRGFSTDALIYAPHFQGVLPATQTVWPSGYPFTIALTSMMGLEVKTAALVLNLIAHAFAALLVWLILLRMRTERFFAALCAFAFYFMAVPWMYVSAALTEPVFTTLILASLLALPNPRLRNTLPWIVCGLLIAACITVRYSGVFQALGTGIGIFCYLLIYLPGRWSFATLLSPLCKLTLLLTIPTAVFGYLMYRTYSVVGTLDRYSGTKTPETIASTIKRWLVKFSELIGFATNEPAASDFVNYLFLAFTLLVILLVGLFLGGKNNFFRPTFKSTATQSTVTHTSHANIDYLRIFTLVATSHALILMMYLSINSVKSSPLEIITRYIYQIYPAFYALFCYMLFALLKQNTTAKKPIIKAMSTAVIALYAIAQALSLTATRPTYFEDSTLYTEIMDLQVNDSVSIKDYINNCFANDQFGKTLWSPHAQRLYLYTDLPSITHGANYTDEPFNAEELQQRIKQYDIGMFVFFSLIDEPSETYNKYMDTTKTWISKNGFANVALKESTFGQNQTIEIYSPDPHCVVAQ